MKTKMKDIESINLFLFFLFSFHKQGKWLWHAGIASKSPLAVTGTKAVLLRSREVSLDQGLDYVATWNSAMLLSDDLKEAISAHTQKRKPVFAKLWRCLQPQLAFHSPTHDRFVSFRLEGGFLLNSFFSFLYNPSSDKVGDKRGAMENVVRLPSHLLLYYCLQNLFYCIVLWFLRTI